MVLAGTLEEVSNESWYQSVRHNFTIRAFRLLADKVVTTNLKDEVYTIFNVIVRDLNITTVKHLLPDDLTDLKNDDWKKLHNWKRWWTREEHLSRLSLFDSNSP